MVYDRRIGDRELSFEASGALLDASLVMRDRETDSWWSIMTSSAIGGDLNGADLVELPAGAKMQWKEWRERHPDTVVLSVGGEEHVDNNPYDGYFASQETFRGLKVEDDRLKPKEPIYSFWLEGEPYAVAHRAYTGGRLFELEEPEGRKLLLYRRKGASIYESSRAYLVASRVAASNPEPEQLLAMADSDEAEGIEKLSGFDTFWYNWIAVNKDSKLIR